MHGLKFGVATELNTSSKKLPVVYSCSGCSDAGELADRIARKLARSGVAEMSCIAGVGGDVKPLVNKARSAGRILAIDGCPLNCTAHSLRRAGVMEFQHLELQTIGFRKGKIDVTEEAVAKGINAAAELLERHEVPVTGNHG